MLEPLDLVALHVADQVPADLRRHVRHLLQRLLDPILSDVLEPHAARGGDGVRTMSLGHRYDPNGLPMPTAGHRCIDALPDLGHALRQVWKRHNRASYRRLQSEAREREASRTG